MILNEGLKEVMEEALQITGGRMFHAGEEQRPWGGSVKSPQVPKGSRAPVDGSLVLALQGQNVLLICSLHLPMGLPVCGFDKPWHWEPFSF